MKIRASSSTANYTPVRVTKPCRHCGEWFIGTPKGIYCSKQCCEKYSAKHRKPRDRSKDRRSSWQRPERGPFTCRCCHKEYMTTRRKGEGEKYCSRDCYRSYQHSKKIIKAPFNLIYFKKCTWCSSTFIARKIHTNTCSDSCRKSYANNTSRLYSINKHKKKAKVYKCAICCTTYCRVYGVKGLKYCSDECFRKSDAYQNYQKQKRASKSYRNHKARVINGKPCEKFNPFEIFDRDKWRCQACGIKTPKRLRGSYKDNAPELDHIVPLSKGGSHTRANVRCCCRKCNGTKGNGVMNDQLMMFG